jgi:hypothetical protein
MADAEMPKENDAMEIIDTLEKRKVSGIEGHHETLKNRDLDRTRFVYWLLRGNLERARELLKRRSEKPEAGTENEMQELLTIVESNFDELLRAARGPGVLMIDTNPGETGRTWDDIDNMLADGGFGWVRRDSEKKSRRLIPTEKGSEVLSRFDEFKEVQREVRRVAAQRRETGEAVSEIVS